MTEKKEETKAKTIFQKLLEIGQAVDAVEKKGHNDYGDYNYMRAVDVARTFRQEFYARNLFPVLAVSEILPFINESGKQKNGVRIRGELTIYDLDTDCRLTVPSYGEGVDSGDKAIYKAQTGCYKYALRNLFLLPDEKADPEADNEGSVPDSSYGMPSHERQPERKGPQRVKEEDVSQERRQPPADESDLITEPQRKRLFAIARAAHPDAGEADIKDIVSTIISKHGFESTKDITKGVAYDHIVAEAGGDKLKVKQKRGTRNEHDE